MGSDIIPTSEFIDALQKKYGSIEIPGYKFRDWFSKERRVFFDCSSEDPDSCLAQVLSREDFSYFTVFFVIQDKAHGGIDFMNVQYRNPRTESLEHFICRYHSQLKYCGLMSLEACGEDYIEYVGCSYEEW